MLKLRNICKYYKVGKNKDVILDNINIDFKKKELVFITGKSGSGKSTLLNIISGNLKCDSGEIYLDNRLVNGFNEKKLNNYRGSVIGNIFQDYNLIDYMSVIDNIMFSYTNGMSRSKIDILLKQLGIYDKKNIIVSKLSGGEKQRVAIARAMVKEPDIILADEPTGALDSKNGIEIMEILKKISKNKLVIVVSHDNYLANKYADRIIEIKDGKCEYYPVIDNEMMNEVRKCKFKISYLTKMAFKNLWLKKIRTLFTSIAISLGVISMILILCLASSFNKEIYLLEERIVSVFPISISNGDFEILDSEKRSSDNKIIVRNNNEWIHTNKITSEYVDYLNSIDEIDYMTYNYDVSMPIISDSYIDIDNKYLELIPSSEFIDKNYDILYGRNIINSNEILLRVDSNNNMSSDIVNSFNIYNDIDYDDVIGRKIKVIDNDNYYIENNGYYYINYDNKNMYDNSDIELVIVGVIREKEIVNDTSSVMYSNQLLDRIININSESKIVNSQINSNYNILGIDMNKDNMLNFLGYNSLPSNINLYVDNLDDKEIVLSKLDEYNDKNDKLIYVDMMADAINIVKDFVMIISVILVMFSVISIIISSLMIGILTNIRVLERKKEIGIFRSMGASKKDIVNLFNIENIFLGIISSLIGICFVCLIKDFVNSLLDSLLEIENVFSIHWGIVLVVVLFNILIVKISGSIPSRRASKLEIVNCIYNR